MTKDERQELYQLFSQFWPHARLLKDASMRTAWGKILKDFPAKDVKSRVMELAATSKYPPDLADITAALAPIALTQRQQTAGATVPLPAGAHRTPTQEELKETQKLREAVENMGGVCPILRQFSGEGGSCGDIFRRHIPQDCPPDCRVLTHWGSCERKARYSAEAST